MRYSAEQVDLLAAEYVLGSLHGPARRRFTTLLGERGEVRNAVWRWERQLNGLAGAIPEQTPPKRVWKGIEKRISARPGKAPRLGGFWRGLGVGLPAAVAAAWLLATWLPLVTFDRIAVFTDAQTLWVIRVDGQGGQFEVRAINPVATEGGRVYELWALPEGESPQSLGLLPLTGLVEGQLEAGLLQALNRSPGLAVSVEPAGGSPTGLPTGPIPYQTDLVRL